MSYFLVDTDVLIDALRGAKPFALPPGSNGAYSVITRVELYAGRRAVEQPIERLLTAMLELGLDRDTATLAGQLRRAHDLNLADAVIAATAERTDRVVVTRNRRHFERVVGVEVLGPEELAPEPPSGAGGA